MQGRLETYLQKEIFIPIDRYFARAILGGREDLFAEILFCYLLAAARAGHLCVNITKDKIYPPACTFTEELQEAQALEKEVREAFYNLSPALYEEVKDKKPTMPILRAGSYLYLQKNYLLERNFLLHLKRLQKQELKVLTPLIEVDSCCNEQQTLALQRALTYPVSVISGGPGTGKTFTAVEIVRSFLQAIPAEEKSNVRIKLAAPTGKAAALLEKNIMSKVGALPEITCGTIHSFLKTGAREEGFQRSLFADLLLIDEASMLDAKLFVRLLSGLLGGGRLVLMGDKDQLPPVESGGFFSDLIDLSAELNIPATILSTGIRAEKEDLRELAQAILQKNLAKLKKARGVTLFSSLNGHLIKDLIVKECKTYFSFGEGIDPLVALQSMERFRLLSPIKKGPFGVDTLNRMILEGFLYGRRFEERMICPILIGRNDAFRGLMNGDTGILIASVSSLQKGIFSSEDKAYFLSKDGLLQARELAAVTLPPFTYAYCLSIHKSQGSEYESVLVVLPRGSEKFGREVLYTAVTRAKKSVQLAAEEEALKVLLEKSSGKISGLTCLLR